MKTKIKYSVTFIKVSLGVAVLAFLLIAIYFADAATTIGTNISTDGTLTVSGATTLNGNVTLGDNAADSHTVNGTTTFNADKIVLEGATANDYETTLSVTDPTADRTLTLPNATDTFALLAETQTLTNKTLTAPTITFTSGSTPITANGSFTIDLANSSNTTLTVKNSDTGTAALSVDGGLTIAGGTSIAQHYSGSGTVGSGGMPISANACIEDPITVTGVNVGANIYTVALGPPTTFEPGLVATGFVSSDNTVTVRVCNPTASSATNSNATWRVDVWRH